MNRNQDCIQEAIDTWNLDITFATYIRDKLQDYCKYARNIVDLETDEYELSASKDKKYNELEAIVYIIDACNDYLKYSFTCDEEEIKSREKMNKALHLFAEIFPRLWW